MNHAAADYLHSPREVQFLEQVRTAGLPEPEHQRVICDRHVDFAWPDRRVCVEIQGGSWTRGAHTRGAGYAKDRMLNNKRQLAGWIVLEFTSDHLDADEAVPVVARALEKREAQWTQS